MEIRDQKMSKELKIRVPYVSVWDGGVLIATSANLNIRTGEITDIETVDPQGTAEILEREYIVLNDEQIDVDSSDGEGYWIQLRHDRAGPCTENYLAHMEAMSDLSVTDLIKVVDYVVSLSQFLTDDNEILDDMDSILEPLNKIISVLKTEESCWHPGCDSNPYMSDVPQYDLVCAECDENY